MAQLNVSSTTTRAIKAVTGYEFTNPANLSEALDTTGLHRRESNQRLALLGDAALKLALLDDWYPTGYTKGCGHNIVVDIGGNASLARVGHECAISHYIVTHPGHFGRVSDKVVAATVEAIIGAIYVDSGKDIAVVKSAMEALGLITSSSTY
ncbi:RNAse III [Cryomyces antarcticus]